MIEHQSAKALKEEWITPRWITDYLGPFDLDPCAPIKPPWKIAGKTYTIVSDGLKQPWDGFVWLNPPYGRKTHEWIARLAHHGNGIGLTMARTETKFFHDEIWNKSDAVFFFKGRIYYHHLNGSRAAANAGAPSVLIAYGREAVLRLRGFAFGHPGKLLELQAKIS